MFSSGQRVYWIDAFRPCDNEGCSWEGTVEVQLDPEIGVEGYTCPVCGYEYEGDYDPVWE